MKTYKAEFIGRTVGAIGTSYFIERTIEGNNEDEARLRLYDRYEHIHELKLTIINEE